jgi:hypothetical protein
MFAKHRFNFLFQHPIFRGLLGLLVERSISF